MKGRKEGRKEGRNMKEGRSDSFSNIARPLSMPARPPNWNLFMPNPMKENQKWLHWICVKFDTDTTSKDSLQSGRSSSKSFEKIADVSDGLFISF